MLLAIEIFVLPGLGVCGLTGMILVVGSLGLVAYGHWPRTTEEWMGYGRTLGPMGISIMGAICLAFLLARYLPSIPLANRLLLKPHSDEDRRGRRRLGAAGDAAGAGSPAGGHRRGRHALAAGRQDAVRRCLRGRRCRGQLCCSRSRVQVIEIEGNRVVVKEV